jgi:nitroreductase
MNSNHFFDLLRRRRSIRAYTEMTIDPESVELLVETLLRAPSSRSINPWEFVLVDDRELLTALSGAKEHGSSFLRNAALGIVVCADSRKSDVWVEDCAIASILVQMAAVSLGLGSCWIQIRNREHTGGKTSEKHVQELLGLPEHLKVESIISIGFPAETKIPVPAGDLDYNKVKLNRYAAQYPKRRGTP